MAIAIKPASTLRYHKIPGIPQIQATPSISIKIGQLDLGHPELHRQVMGVAPHELIAEIMVLVASVHETLDIQADDPGQIRARASRCQ